MARGCNYKPPPFLSTLSLRRATVRPRCRGCPAAYFYPRSPCGERPLVHQLRGLADVSISIHALLAESDLIEFRKLLYPGNFYPRSPCGERPQKKKINPASQTFLSTLSLRRATAKNTRDCATLRISIHALLAESDQAKALKVSALCNFYPRSPCGERPPLADGAQPDAAFLSTLSLRRATGALAIKCI